MGKVRNSENRLALALVRCALFSYCSDKITEEHGDLLEALSELHSSFPDKPAEWFYRATYRLLAGKVEKVGAEHWLVKGFARVRRHVPLVQRLGERGRYRCDCFFRTYGYVRKARICTHIATVMLYRRQLRLRVE
ncbi:hypothetical protein [Infirmifilum sp. SLHALR2]|nr:MAG: hypothetical protein B7L53_08985 [Thermofilum sp. NZ13]